MTRPPKGMAVLCLPSISPPLHTHKYICRSVSNKYLLGTHSLTALYQDLATSPCLQGQQAQERDKFHFKAGVCWGGHLLVSQLQQSLLHENRERRGELGKEWSSCATELMGKGKKESIAPHGGAHLCLSRLVWVSALVSTKSLRHPFRSCQLLWSWKIMVPSRIGSAPGTVLWLPAREAQKNWGFLLCLLWQALS